MSLEHSKLDYSNKIRAQIESHDYQRALQNLVDYIGEIRHLLEDQACELSELRNQISETRWKVGV